MFPLHARRAHAHGAPWPPEGRQHGGGRPDHRNQLNKGESLHALRNFLFLANLGQIRSRSLEDQANQALCLTVVTNAVILWNTVYMARVLEQLRAEGHEVSDDDVAHLSPARFEHINPFGRYHFDVALARRRVPARPLRRPGCL